MNRVNDWKELMKLANDDLGQYKMRLVTTEEDGCYTLTIFGPGAKDSYCFGENYYEDELGDLVNDAWAHAKAKGQRAQRPRMRGYGNSERIAEVVYDITATIEQTLATYVEDSRGRFSIIWEWAQAFEYWWGTLTDDEQDRNDYMLSVEKFAEAKMAELAKVRQPRIFSEKVAEYGVSVRVYNVLKACGIVTFGDLCSLRRPELMRLRNFGRKSLHELDELVEKMHLEWGSAPMVPRLKDLYRR